MNVIQSLDRLQLYEYGILHEYVCHIIANHDPVVSNLDPFLLLY